MESQMPLRFIAHAITGLWLEQETKKPGKYRGVIQKPESQEQNLAS
jgi:hypothetical protein